MLSNSWRKPDAERPIGKSRILGVVSVVMDMSYLGYESQNRTWYKNTKYKRNH
jgi:hypothetical protein